MAIIGMMTPGDIKKERKKYKSRQPSVLFSAMMEWYEERDQSEKLLFDELVAWLLVELKHRNMNTHVGYVGVIEIIGAGIAAKMRWKI